MTNLTLRFEPCVAKYWTYIHQEFSPDRRTLPNLLRCMVLTVVEPLYPNEPKAYTFDRHEDGEANLDKIFHESLTDHIVVKISNFVEGGDASVNFNHNRLWVPPLKMYYLNKVLKELINQEINSNVEKKIESNGQIKDGILEVFDRYGMDETDYKLDSALKMNQRFRQRMAVS